MYLKFHSNDLEGVRVMETINMQCKKYLSNTLRYLLYAESCLSGRAYIGEVLIQIWLKSMQK